MTPIDRRIETTRTTIEKMNTINAFIKEHALLAFFVLAFSISWAGILPIIGGPGGFIVAGSIAEQPVDTSFLDSRFHYVMMAWLAGPSLSCIIITALVDGKAGLRDLITKLTTSRHNKPMESYHYRRWMALVLLLAPLMFATVALALTLAVSTAFLPSILVAEDKASLVFMAVAYGIFGGGFCEELGWTGFAVPRFRQRFGVFATGIILGLLWGAYHFNVVYLVSRPSSVLEVGLILPLQLFAWLPAYRVLMVWVYDMTKSLPMAMMMHASLTAGMLMFQPAEMAGTVLLTFIVAWAATWWMIVAVGAAVVRNSVYKVHTL